MHRALWLIAALLALLALTTPLSAESPEPKLAIIVNRKAEISKLGVAELTAIFTVAQKRWSNGTTVVPFNYPAKDPLRVQFDHAVLNMDPDAVAKFWVDQRIRGQARPPRHVPSRSLMARVVAALPGAIGYVPLNEVPDGVVVVAYLVDGKIVAAGNSRGSQ